MPRRVLIYRSMMLKGSRGLLFLNGIVFHVVVSYKYIGHYIRGSTDDLSDDEDINRQRRTLLFKAIILRKFPGVKLTLFRTYGSPM